MRPTFLFLLQEKRNVGRKRPLCQEGNPPPLPEAKKEEAPCLFAKHNPPAIQRDRGTTAVLHSPMDDTYSFLESMTQIFSSESRILGNISRFLVVSLQTKVCW